jgi:hypothetical protein
VFWLVYLVSWVQVMFLFYPPCLLLYLSPIFVNIRYQIILLLYNCCPLRISFLQRIQMNLNQNVLLPYSYFFKLINNTIEVSQFSILFLNQVLQLHLINSSGRCKFIITIVLLKHWR